MFTVRTNMFDIFCGQNYRAVQSGREGSDPGGQGGAAQGASLRHAGGVHQVP
jgi:hypothetical protein